MIIFQVGLTISKANRYETADSTTEALSGAQEAQELLVSQTSSKTSTSGDSSTPKTNIVLREYNVSKTDLAIFTQEGAYKRGRPDPFAEVTASPANSSSASGSSNVGGSSNTGNQTSSDGTYYNSSRVK